LQARQRQYIFLDVSFLPAMRIPARGAITQVFAWICNASSGAIRHYGNFCAHGTHLGVLEGYFLEKLDAIAPAILQHAGRILGYVSPISDVEILGKLEKSQPIQVRSE
jgi:hypothetical protein